MKRFLCLLLTFFPLLASPQIIFDFNDTSLTGWDQSAPNHWNVDTVAIGSGYSEMLHHDFDNPSSGHDQIAHTLIGLKPEKGKVVWRFQVKHGYNPSSENNWAVFLVSDKSSAEMFPGGKASGYIVGVNYTGSDDMIKLWKVENGNITEVINSSINWETTIGINNFAAIEVSRSPGGFWKLSMNSAGNFNELQNIGNGVDADYTDAYWFGVYYKYSSSQDRKLWIDNISIDGTFIPDTKPPTIDTLKILSDQEISIIFSEPVVDSCLNKSHFSLTGYEISIDSVWHSDDQQLFVWFSKPFPSGVTLTLVATAITDLSGNVAKHIEKQLLYYKPVMFDVVFNEIMADPSPPVGLPEYEYIELFNRTSYEINLKNWKLLFGSYSHTFPDVSIKANGFVILCSASGESSLSAYGQTIAILNNGSSLTNSGQLLQLKDSTGQLIHFINYSDAWFINSFKKDGGWSLEQIDPNDFCGRAANWASSKASAGGTPGKANSVMAKSRVQNPPSVAKLLVPTDSTLTIIFSEPVLPFIDTTWLVIKGKGNAGTASIDIADASRIQAGFKYKFVPNIEYKLKISDQLTNCQSISNNKALEVPFYLPQHPDSFDIVINEVLFDAFPYGSEFVEVYNRSDKVLDAGSTYIASIDTTTCKIKSMLSLDEKGAMIYPGQYLAITQSKQDIQTRYEVHDTATLLENPNLPSLPDKWGIVGVTNKQGGFIDRFKYNRSMHSPMISITEGVSLERIWFDQPTNSGSNWYSASQTAGYATPGYKNSQALNSKDYDDGFSILPEMFTPNNDGIDDLACIYYKIQKPGNATITIFSSQGLLINHLVKNAPLGTEGVFKWDGTDDQQKPVASGIYIIFIQMVYPKGETLSLKKTVLLGR